MKKITVNFSKTSRVKSFLFNHVNFIYCHDVNNKRYFGQVGVKHVSTICQFELKK